MANNFYALFSKVTKETTTERKSVFDKAQGKKIMKDVEVTSKRDTSLVASIPNAKSRIQAIREAKAIAQQENIQFVDVHLFK